MEASGVLDRKRKRSALEADRREIDSADGLVIAKEENFHAGGARSVPEEASNSSSSSSTLVQASTRVPPSEEEVEEFFAILRRIHSAVKCIDKRSQGHVSGIGRWTELEAGLSTSMPALVNGGSSMKLTKAEVEVVGEASNGVNIDLNAVPEETAEANSR